MKDIAMKFNLILLLLCSVLTAQTIQNRTGQTGIWRTHNAQTGGRTRLSTSLGMSYALPGTYLESITGIEGKVRSETSSLQYTNMNWEAAVSYGLFENFDISVLIPFHQDWISTGQFCDSINGTSYLWPGTDNVFGMGDPELAAKVQIPFHRFFSLGYYAAFSFPLGSDSDANFPRKTYYLRSDGKVQGFFTSGSMEMENRILATIDFRGLPRELPVRVHFNAGARVPFEVDTLDQLVFLNAGLDISPFKWMTLFTEYSLETRSINWDRVNRDPASVTPGIAFHTPQGLSAVIGMDFSLSHDKGFIYENAGVEGGNESTVIIETAPQPKRAIVASVQWAMQFKEDRDLDNIIDSEDKCPDEREDVDGFMDLDGCPDLDNDGDAFPDVEDSCPNLPETMNGVSDLDGCPDYNPHIIISGEHADKHLGVTFVENSDLLDSSSFMILSSIGETMKKMPELTFHIVGYADSINSEENDLAEKRATQVKYYLMKFEIDPVRITTEGRYDAQRQVEIIRTDNLPKPKEEKVEEPLQVSEVQEVKPEIKEEVPVVDPDDDW